MIYFSKILFQKSSTKRSLFMIDRLIDDINKALDAEAYMAALSLALILPDICAKAEHNNNTKERGNKTSYIEWFDEHIGRYEKSPQKDENELSMPYLSGEVIYQLRCSVLHQGTPNIDKCRIQDESCKIDNFSLIVEKQNPFNIYSDGASVSSNRIDSTNLRSYSLNVRRLCLIITSTVKNYYKENKDKFDFFDYQIYDQFYS